MQQHEAARLTLATSVGSICGKNLPVKAKANCECRFHVYLVCTVPYAWKALTAHGVWANPSLQAVNCRPPHI